MHQQVPGNRHASAPGDQAAEDHTQAASRSRQMYPLSPPLLGPPDDPAEREADDVAERVLPRLNVHAGEAYSRPERISIAADPRGPAIRRQADGAGAAGAGTPISPDAHAALSAQRGRGGFSVPGELQGSFGRMLGPQARAARLHHDGESDRLAAKFGADAFSIGGDVFFKHGSYAPGTLSGKRLLAHELVHVEQDGGRGNVVRRSGGLFASGGGRSSVKFPRPGWGSYWTKFKPGYGNHRRHIVMSSLIRQAGQVAATANLSKKKQVEEMVNQMHNSKFNIFNGPGGYNSAIGGIAHQSQKMELKDHKGPKSKKEAKKLIEEDLESISKSSVFTGHREKAEIVTVAKSFSEDLLHAMESGEDPEAVHAEFRQFISNLHDSTAWDISGAENQAYAKVQNEALRGVHGMLHKIIRGSSTNAYTDFCHVHTHMMNLDRHLEDSLKGSRTNISEQEMILEHSKMMSLPGADVSDLRTRLAQDNILEPPQEVHSGPANNMISMRGTKMTMPYKPMPENARFGDPELEAETARYKRMRSMNRGSDEFKIEEDESGGTRYNYGNAGQNSGSSDKRKGTARKMKSGGTRRPPKNAGAIRISQLLGGERGVVKKGSRNELDDLVKASVLDAVKNSKRETENKERSNKKIMKGAVTTDWRARKQTRLAEVRALLLEADHRGLDKNSAYQLIVNKGYTLKETDEAFSKLATQ